MRNIVQSTKCYHCRWSMFEPSKGDPRIVLACRHPFGTTNGRYCPAFRRVDWKEQVHNVYLQDEKWTRKIQSWHDEQKIEDESTAIGTLKDKSVFHIEQGGYGSGE